MPPPPRALAAVCAVADRLAAAGVPWLLTGSAGRALLGAAARPADVDLEVAEGDAERAAAALGTAAAPASGGGRSSLRASAVLAGVEVDLSAGFAMEGPELRLPDGYALMAAWALPATAAGRRILVAPPEETLVRRLVAGDRAGAARLEATPGLPPLRAAYVAERLRSASSTATR
ncbi:MAG TPA: hypothetical protein PKD59_13855 [Miltoncostaeaceae bacterium]|nr:hypothetical protein [Miltoncostaeaceae bacterium]